MATIFKRVSFRQGIVMWIAGMIGIIPMILIMPTLFAAHTLTTPLWVLSLNQLIQSGVLVALAVVLGISLAPQLGLRAPAFEALASGKSPFKILHHQLRSGLSGGIIVGILMAIMTYMTPPSLAIIGELKVNFSLKFLAEIFYGGITEEILTRWGVMTFILWALWKLAPFKQKKPPHPILVWIAIIASALLFGMGHIPAAQAIVGDLTHEIITYIIAGNMFAGLIFGYLYQRFGLESAIIAHMMAHLINEIIKLI